MIEEFQRGARGVMPGSDMIPIFVEIWNRLEAGDEPAAWRAFTQALPLIRFELQPGLGVSAMKHNLAAAGVIRCSRVRHPTSTLDPRSLNELRFLREMVNASVGVNSFA
jgi:4-hydroxy-tetrahydrodipicolinate synthase